MNNEFDIQDPALVAPPKRRRFTRVNAALVVDYTFASSSGKRMLDQEYQGKSRDISGGGCLLEGSIPEREWIPALLLEDIKLEVDITFPGDRPTLHTEATVAWIDPDDSSEEAFQLGLEFQDLPDDERKHIIDFVIRETSRKD